MKLANSRGVVAVHDKDGWLGALRFWQRLAEHDGLTLRVWQSLPHEKVGELESADVRSGLGDDYLRLGYLKAFMDGTLGSQTARLLDGTGVEITSREELEEIIRRGARAGFPVAVHAIGDLANRDALDAFEATQDVWRPLGLRHRIEHAQLLDARGRRALRRLGVAASVQFSPRDVRSRPRGALLGGRDRARVRVALALGRRRAGRERLRRADRGARPVGRRRRGRAAHARRAAAVASRAGGDARGGAARDVRRAGVARGRRARARQAPARLLADLVVLDRDPFAIPVDELPSVRVVATMVGGRWVHNPPPWD